jgi:7-cyano-7-deazaguanine synthase in queuosine biosynthesis
MHSLHIWPQPFRVEGSSHIRSAIIELSGHAPQELWYRFPKEQTAWLTESCDPFLVASIMMAMKNGANIHVHGQVSPSLIVNLYEFQSAWHCWDPSKYKRVEIVADAEREVPYRREKELAITAFSGGVDSTYTVWMHKEGKGPYSRRKLEAGLFVQGFDIPLSQNDYFIRASKRARLMLNGIGMEMIAMATNHRDLNPDWDDAYGVALASCLMWFAKRYNEAVIPSTHSYALVDRHLGSNPVTDRLLSTKAFQIIHDGAGVTRYEKLAPIRQWADAYTHLRVCSKPNHRDQNCGKCGKCVTTLLSLRKLGLAAPPSFPREITDEDILAVRHFSPDDMALLEAGLQKSLALGQKVPWTSAVSRTIRYHKTVHKLATPRSNRATDLVRRVGLKILKHHGP